MPAWRDGMQMTVKIVNVFDGNVDIDLPNHLALINLFDPNTGATSCVMDGTYITGLRTAASSVLYSPHAEPERVSDCYGDRGGCARVPARAPRLASNARYSPGTVQGGATIREEGSFGPGGWWPRE